MTIHDMYHRFSCKQLICSHSRWGRVVVVVGGVVEGGGRMVEGRRQAALSMVVVSDELAQ